MKLYTKLGALTLGFSSKVFYFPSKLQNMGIYITVSAFILLMLFSGIAYLKDIRQNGKLSKSSRWIIIIFLFATLVGVSDLIFKWSDARQDKQDIIDTVKKYAPGKNNVKNPHLYIAPVNSSLNPKICRLNPLDSYNINFAIRNDGGTAINCKIVAVIMCRKKNSAFTCEPPAAVSIPEEIQGENLNSVNAGLIFKVIGGIQDGDTLFVYAGLSCENTDSVKQPNLNIIRAFTSRFDSEPALEVFGEQRTRIIEFLKRNNRWEYGL